MSERLFENKVAIVTGGGLGMGRLTALRFGQEGAKVCVADIDPKTAEKTADEIRQAGGEAFACIVDISREEDNERMVSETVKRYGGVDVAHLNAAILGKAVNFFTSTVDDFDRVISINLRGMYLGLRCIGKVIRSQGAVVAMSSTAGLTGMDSNAAYSATKHGIIGLAKSATPAFAAKGARVNVICPGMVNTRLYNPDAVGEALVPASELTMPEFQRVGTAQHIAEVVLFLASSRASFITGAVHTVDGGLLSAFVTGMAAEQ